MVSVLSRLAPAKADAHVQAGVRKRAGQKVLLHFVCLVYFSRIILWHFTDPIAKTLPGSVGFGWFFKFFTFCSFSAQTVQFFLCLLDDLTSKAHNPPLRRAADVFSCTMFCMANTVSTMFYFMSFLTDGKAEIPCPHRPDWLSPTVHIHNAVAAWGDLLVSDTRTFSPATLALNFAMSVAYICWLLLVGYKNQHYPYPFLNHVRQPHGLIVTCALCNACMLMWYLLGSKLRNLLRTGLSRAVRVLHVQASRVKAE